jgi:hypothetical protein
MEGIEIVNEFVGRTPRVNAFDEAGADEYSPYQYPANIS